MSTEPDSLDRSLEQIASDIIQRFEVLSGARDYALTHGRQVIRLSANAVRALHRTDDDDATRLLDQARSLLDDIRAEAAGHPSVYWAGYVQDAMKEYAEAVLTAAILRGEPLPTPGDLGVEDAPYLNALAEAASELRRDTLDALRADEITRAGHLMDAMDTMYAALVSVDFPDAVTGGLRRTTDQLRAVLERTRGDLTIAVRQNRLERALRDTETDVGRLN